jgi:hypothetical protein
MRYWTRRCQTLPEDSHPPHALPGGAQAGAEGVRNCWQYDEAQKTKPGKNSVFPGSAGLFATLRGEMLRQGFEPAPKNTGKQADSESGRPTGRPKTQEVDLEAITEALAALPPDRLVALLAAAIQSRAATK